MKQFLLMTCLFLAIKSDAQLAIFTFNGTGACPTQGSSLVSQPANATVSSVTRTGALVCSSTNDVFNTTTWSSSGSMDATQYIEVSVTAAAGYIINFSSLSFTELKSSTGPVNARVAHDGGAGGTFSTSAYLDFTPATTQSTINFTGGSFASGVGATVRFRIYGWGSTSSSGALRIDDLTINATVTTPSGASGFWLPTGNDIYNSNTGNVGIGTTTPVAPLTVAGSNTASSAIARGTYLTPQLTAAANNDALVGLDINPTYTAGSFTGVNKIAIRNITGDNVFNTSSGRTIMGSTGISSIWNLVVRANIYSGIMLQNAATGTSLTSPYNGGSLWMNSDGSFAQMLMNNWNSTGIAIYNGSSANAGMVLFGSNNLAINSLTDAGFKMDVNGTTRLQSSLLVGTGTQNSSSLVELQSTTKGFLPPKMTTAQQNAIASPTAGLMIYNTDNSAYSYYNGTAWTTVSSGSGPWTASGSDIYNNNTGNVGIGTATPAARLSLGLTDRMIIGTPDINNTEGASYSSTEVRFRAASNYYMKMSMVPGAYEMQFTNGHYNTLAGIRADLFRGNYINSINGFQVAKINDGQLQLGGIVDYSTIPLVVKQYADMGPFLPAQEVYSSVARFTGSVIGMTRMGMHMAPVHTTADNMMGISFGSFATPEAAMAGIYVNSGSPGTTMHFGTSDDGAVGSKERMMINYDGNVAIGKTAPDANAKLDVAGNIFSSGKIVINTTDMTQVGTYSLAVNGSAIFTKAVVKLNSVWPDYVFADDYKPVSLPELERYIQQNKHLPELPSASDVAKNGIDLGDNQGVLLKKIEEITLYTIEQDKKLSAQAEEIKKLQEQNTLLLQLQKEVTELKKKIHTNKN